MAVLECFCFFKPNQSAPVRDSALGKSIKLTADNFQRSLTNITSAVQSFSTEIDRSDDDPVGIASVIYHIGMTIGNGKPLSYVDTICAEIERNSPKKKWNKVRRSDCRRLLRRYWEIPRARELLASAGQQVSYHFVLSVLRITSRGLGVEAAVAEFLDGRSAANDLPWLLTQVEKAASKAGYLILKTQKKGDDVTVYLQKQER